MYISINDKNFYHYQRPPVLDRVEEGLPCLLNSSALDHELSRWNNPHIASLQMAARVNNRILQPDYHRANQQLRDLHETLSWHMLGISKVKAGERISFLPIYEWDLDVFRPRRPYVFSCRLLFDSPVSSKTGDLFALVEDAWTDIVGLRHKAGVCPGTEEWLDYLTEERCHNAIAMTIGWDSVRLP